MYTRNSLNVNSQEFGARTRNGCIRRNRIKGTISSVHVMSEVKSVAESTRLYLTEKDEMWFYALPFSQFDKRVYNGTVSTAELEGEEYETDVPDFVEP